MVDPLLTGQPGRYVVSGVAGGGVTALVCDSAVSRIRDGWDSDSLLLITPTKTAATTCEQLIAADLIGAPVPHYVSTAKIARSIHSVAFMIVRAAAGLHAESTPRLMTGGEQDAILRHLLAGHAETGTQWPEQWQPALTYRGFARGVRDFLLRAVERVDITGPQESLFERIRAEIERIGRAENNSLWVSAAALLEEYRQVDRLENGPRYNAAELMAKAVDLLRSDDAVRQATIGHLCWVGVDDAQHLDPRSAELVELLMGEATQAIIAGNPDELVFSFRGASAQMLTHPTAADVHIHLDVPHRVPTHRSVIYGATPQQEIDAVADTVRRLHLLDGVPWTDIIVVVRTAGQIGPLRQRLLTAGVPVHVDPGDLILAEQPMVAALLAALHILVGDATDEQILSLAIGPIGAVDPVTLRRIYRELSASELVDVDHPAPQVCAQIIAGTVELPETLAIGDTAREMIERVRSVLAAGRAAVEANAGLEMVLWELWNATGLGPRLAATSLRGGAAGSQADRDLDAMMELFDQAGDYVEWKESATLLDFLQFIEEQELPTSIRERRTVRADAVTIDTAHAVIGGQWPVVIMPHVNEGVWPSLELTGTLFDQEVFVDLVSENISTDTYIDRVRGRAQEEQRLFDMVTARATERLVLTAIKPGGEDSPLPQPSSLLTGLTAGWDRSGMDYTEEEYTADRAPQVLSAATVIATLRRRVCDPDTSPANRNHAAHLLAQLADAQFAAADPAYWWGTAEASSTTPLFAENAPITLSPSSVQQALECPLRYILRSRILPVEPTAAMQRGSILHAYAEAVAQSDRDLRPLLAEQTIAAILRAERTPAWKQATMTEKLRAALAKMDSFIDAHADMVDAIEEELIASLGQSPGGHEVILRGRVDWIDRSDNSGETVYTVYDWKTGNHAITMGEAADHPQLKSYQLMLLAGDPPRTPAGARLLYPMNTAKSLTTRDQKPLTEEDAAAFAESLRTAADALAGGRIEVARNRGCATCEFTQLCPIGMGEERK